MNINYKQAQFELFPAGPGNADRIHKPQIFFSSLTFSLENIVILSIFIFMTVIFSFSLGVERGKRIILRVPLEMEHMLSGRGSSRAVKAGQSDSKQMLPSSATNVVTDVAPQEKTIEKSSPQQQEIRDPTYTIQVASFKKEEYAQQEAVALRKKGFEIFVVPKGEYSIVCVGKFVQKDEAKVTLNRLQKTYRDCIVRRL